MICKRKHTEKWSEGVKKQRVNFKQFSAFIWLFLSASSFFHTLEHTVVLDGIYDLNLKPWSQPFPFTCRLKYSTHSHREWLNEYGWMCQFSLKHNPRPPNFQVPFSVFSVTNQNQKQINIHASKHKCLKYSLYKNTTVKPCSSWRLWYSNHDLYCLHLGCNPNPLLGASLPYSFI